MCWILVKPAENEVPYDYIDEAQTKNKDGYGVSWYADKQIHTFRTLDYTAFKEHLKTIENTLMVVHLRFTSAGATDIDNVHPFPVPTGVMFHNGTISCLRGSATCTDSDTNRLAQVLTNCKYKKVSDIAPLIEVVIGTTGNKLVFLNNNGTVDIINRQLGIDDDNGNWYSNDYHIKEVLYPVFVYGTLKEGGSNHTYYMYSAEFLDDATSVDKMAMIEGTSFPYLLGDNAEGHNVKGEIYLANKKALNRLDILEGTPTHYKREIRKFKLAATGELLDAYVYIKTHVTEANLAADFIEEWKVPERKRYIYRNGEWVIDGDHSFLSHYDY